MQDLSPGMRQYMEIKNNHPDCIVLFRMGDFYETFYEDAKTVAEALDIVLTSRGKGERKAPLAGIPYHALEPYLAKLIKQGYKVAIVEQTEDPKKAKGLVKRGLVRIVTPGTILEESMLDNSTNNFLAVVNKQNKKELNDYAIAFCDMSTGDFYAIQLDDENSFFSEIAKIAPSEIVIPMGYENSAFEKEISKLGFTVHSLDDRFFIAAHAKNTIMKHYGVKDIGGFGISDKSLVLSASGALLNYLYKTQLSSNIYLKPPTTYQLKDYMVLDRATITNLELVRPQQDGGKSLLSVIDYTSTPMGKRLLKNWLIRPLLEKAKIEQRLSALSFLVDDVLFKEEIRQQLKKIVDLERIRSRVLYKTANPRDLVAMKSSLQILPALAKLLENPKITNSYLRQLANIDCMENLADYLEKAIANEPPISIREGKFIKHGFNSELDELRKASSSGKKYLLEFEEQERKKTGIKSLKIGYNKVFGYYIDVTKPNLHLVPENYIRKQTQVNSERYITPELKEKEGMILGAEERIRQIEYDLFQDVLGYISEFSAKLASAITAISTIDCIVSLAEVAIRNNYSIPEITSDSSLDISLGRHPVVEAIEPGKFIANDCMMQNDSKVHIITGPNMAGKSTYLRQVALITILAHIGSFVPAASAKIPITDKIFTRIGASDNLVMGKSTFMVEMIESANILNNATSKSLVILDEVGRGTSTYDGFALAWAIVQHLNEEVGCKTLFATHYHQLNSMSEQFKGIRNYNIAVSEKGEDVEFLHKIVEGGTDKSYGIHVAKIAGVPASVLTLAKEMMSKIEREHMWGISQKPLPVPKEEMPKLPEITPKDKVSKKTKKELTQENKTPTLNDFFK